MANLGIEMEGPRLLPPMPDRPRPARLVLTEKQVLSRFGKYPGVLLEPEFLPNGLVRTAEGLMVPAYVGSGEGFEVPRKRTLITATYPDLRKSQIFPLCPFTACGEFLDPGVFDEEISVRESRSRWNKFNREVIASINYGVLMPRALLMVAIMEGQELDSGMCAEVGYFASNWGEVYGVRSDFRLAENIAAYGNPAVTCFAQGEYWGGAFFNGPDAYERLYETLKEDADEIIKQRTS